MSSFYDDASLVVIPSGYKASKVYSQKPTDGTGDLTFTRSLATASRVAENGLIEKVRTNLMLHSQEFDNAYWLKQVGGLASAPVVTANVETAPDGTLTADRIVFNLNGNTLSTDFSQISSATITLSAQENTGSLFLKTTDGTTKVLSMVNPDGVSINISVTGTYQRFTITSSNASAGSFRFRLRGGEGTADTASVAAWGCQFESGVATPYIPTTTAAVSVGMLANVPRLDYLGGGCPKLLLEPQRTNLAFFSENFNNAYWAKTGGTTITANTTISPDGFLNADTIAFAGSGDSLNRIITTGLSVVSGTTYTISIFTKTQTQVIFFGGATTGTGTNVFNGSVDFGNGYFRQSITRTWSASGTVQVQFIISTGTAGSLLITYGCQAELGSYPTSYIPTLGAAVTRSADLAQKTSISSLIGQTEGVVFLDYTVTQAGSSNSEFSISAGSNANAIRLRQSSGNFLQGVVQDGGVTQASIITTSSISVGQRYKIAFAYANNDFAMYVNGQLIGVDGSGSVPACSQIQNTNGGASSSADLAGAINQTLLFKTRLSNADLASLTA